MMLLIWSSEKAKGFARAIEEKIQEEVSVAATLAKGCEHLRSCEYSVVLVDQWISEAEPIKTDLLFDCIGTAVPVFVNFAISNQERILRELRAALSRRGRERILVQSSAKLALRDELKGEITALLLSCGVALREPGLSEPATARLRHIEEVANLINNRLQDSEINGSSVVAAP